MGKNKRLYVLDTNVLMHDPTSMFRFEEHDVFLPMIVLEELDAAKKGLTEVSRNVRQVSRFIGDMMSTQGAARLEDGLELIMPHGLELPTVRGRLYFQTSTPEIHPSLLRKGAFADNEILSTALSLQETMESHEIVLISKDINLRIKAAILNLPAEDYYNDRALDDVDLLYKGMVVEDESFWERYPQVDSWNENGSTYYRIPRIDEDDWFPNQCVVIGEEDSAIEAIVVETTAEFTVLKIVTDYQHGKNSVWGIQARNREQNFALNLLVDPEIISSH